VQAHIVDAPLGAGPESILSVVVMDSGLALRAPRNDGSQLGCCLKIESEISAPSIAITSPCLQGEVALGRQPSPRGGGRTALKQPFFCCERLSPCYKPAAPIAMMLDEVDPKSRM